jgi:hypothetical protein
MRPFGKTRPQGGEKTCAPADEQPESGEAPLGLCINCENLRGCNLHKPASGVWMCEEYC